MVDFSAHAKVSRLGSPLGGKPELEREEHTMFIHAGSLSLLALSATMLTQPVAWSRALADTPPLRPIPQADIPLIAANREDIQIISHTPLLFEPDDGVLYRRLARNFRDDSRIAPPGASVTANCPCAQPEMPKSDWRPGQAKRVALTVQHTPAAPIADTLRYADLALSPEVAGLINIDYASRGRDGQNAATITE